MILFKSIKLILIILCIVVLGLIFANIFIFYQQHPELDKTIQLIITSRGFESETHFIVTPDGYILQTIRILNPHVHDRSKLKPILLHHGFQCSGSLWLVASSGRLRSDRKYIEDDQDDNAVGNSLGFVLAARGYDVWLANYRGNIYSTNHTTLSVHDDKFWNFTGDELIAVDLPAQIEYIRSITQSETISYIGHSLGSAVMFGLLASQPHYREIVEPHIALSPIGFFTHYHAPLRYLTPFRRWILKLAPKDLGTNLMRKLGLPRLCTNRWFQASVCYWIYTNLFGSYKDQVDLKRLPVYFDNILHGASTRILIHFFQNTIKCQPVYYDYDDEVGEPEASRNRQKYDGRDYPPIYTYTNATDNVDIALIYTKSDWFNHLADIYLLKDRMNVKLKDDYAVPDESWNHMDLVWGREVGKYVNARVLKILEEY